MLYLRAHGGIPHAFRASRETSASAASTIQLVRITIVPQDQVWSSTLRCNEAAMIAHCLPRPSLGEPLLGALDVSPDFCRSGNVSWTSCFSSRPGNPRSVARYFDTS